MSDNESHNETATVKPLPWIAGAILILGVAVLTGFYWNSILTVQKVQFKGNYFVSTEDLQKIEIPMGISPDSLNFMEIINRFEEIPYIKRADVNFEPSGNLMVNITERQPIALLSNGDQKMYVDVEGLRLPVIRGKAADVPVLYGFKAEPGGDTLKSESFTAVSDFLKNVRNQPVSNATISEVAWTVQDGVVALTNQNGVKLIFGKNDFKNRLSNWEAFYGEVIKEKGIEQMRSIDLRFRGQIVTREG